MSRIIVNYESLSLLIKLSRHIAEHLSEGTTHELLKSELIDFRLAIERIADQLQSGQQHR